MLKQASKHVDGSGFTSLSLLLRLLAATIVLSSLFAKISTAKTYKLQRAVKREKPEHGRQKTSARNFAQVEILLTEDFSIADDVASSLNEVLDRNLIA